MNEQSIFHQALQLPESEREKYLVESCGKDDSTIERLKKMLALCSQPSDFLEAPAIEQVNLEAILESEQEKVAVMTEKSLNDQHNVNLDFLQASEKPEVLGLLDRFEILSVLGQGGMGIVFKGRDPELDRIVAIKALHEQNIPPAALAASRKRFIREAKAMATIHSDYVIKINEVKKDHTPPFFVMELILGKTLKQKVENEGPVDVLDLLKIGIEIASGLAAAHDSPNKLIHRDIKPENILLENSIERVKIVDFGLAKDSQDEEMTLTQSGEILGTVPYMSPEQAQALPVDTRSDLFSLGATLYYMAAGRAPFKGKSITAILQKVVYEHPVPLQNLRHDFPQKVIDLVEQLIEKEPEQRIQTAQEVVQRLKLELTRLQQPNDQINSGVFQQTVIQKVRPAVVKTEKTSSGWYKISNTYLKITGIVLLLGLLCVGSIYYFSSLPDNQKIDPGEFYVK